MSYFMSYLIPFDEIPEKIIHTKSKTPDGREYYVVKFDKDYLSNYDESAGIYRSVVYSTMTQQLLAFTPPKTLPYRVEYLTAQPHDTILVNEWIEGTMITLFYDKEHHLWEMATKGAVGANYWYYRNQYVISRDNDSSVPPQPTFREMFIDAIGTDQFDEHFDASRNYVFVLQHPANHIVLDIKHPRVYLVAVYTISENRAVFVSPNEYEKTETSSDHSYNIHFPQRFEFRPDSYTTDLVEKYCSIHSDHRMVGLMFTNLHTGERMALENPRYSDVREIRGNHPNLQYQYLCLRSMGKVEEFTKLFPQYRELFWNFYMDFSKYVTNLHQSYVSYYVKKTGIQISKKYFPLIYKIHHQIYLPSLSHGKDDSGGTGAATKTIIKRKVVLDFVNTLTPGELLFYLRQEGG